MCIAFYGASVHNNPQIKQKGYKAMKNLKKVIAVVLCLITMFSVMSISTVAANYTTSYTSYSTPSNSGDYAYWNGSKVVRASGTTVSEVKWMQAALNYCIKYRGLSGSYLDVDGSFGPASKKATTAFQKAYGLSVDGSFGPSTIKKMKDVLKSSPNNNTTTSTAKNDGKITTEMIKAVCDKYGYANGKYWTIYDNNGKKASGTWNASKTYFSNRKNCCSTINKTVKNDLYATNNPVKNGDYYKSYNYQSQYECHGFACYVMAKVVQNITGKNNDVIPRDGSKNGWTKIAAKNATDLKVGDIVRVNGSDAVHSAIVYSIDSNGKITFLEAGGGSACKIRLGVGFDFSTKYYTLQKIKDNFTLEYVYRYTG